MDIEDMKAFIQMIEKSNDESVQAHKKILQAIYASKENGQTPNEGGLNVYTH